MGKLWDEHRAVERHGMISVEPFARRYRELIDQGVRPSTMCERIGWVQSNGYPDTSRLQRACGVRSDTNKVPKYNGRTRKWIRRSTANTLLIALDLDPADVPGL